MIISICDCCNKQVIVGELLHMFVEREHGMVAVFDIGTCCLDKQFNVPSSARIVAKNGFRSRIQDVDQIKRTR